MRTECGKEHDIGILDQAELREGKESYNDHCRESECLNTIFYP